MECLEFKKEYPEDMENHECFELESRICPYCNFAVTYEFFPGFKDYMLQHVFVAQCPNCNNYSLFVSEKSEEEELILHNLIEPKTHKPLSENLKELSPAFCEIYEQTYLAKSNHLTKLIGIGFGKALEQLVHDYLVKVQNDKPKRNFAENIKMLKNFDDAVINLSLSKFVRNDEIHPVKESNFTIDDLMEAVECIVVFFDSKYSTFKLQSKMSSLKPE